MRASRKLKKSASVPGVSVLFVWSISFIWLVLFSWFRSKHGRNQTNQMNQINRNLLGGFHTVKHVTHFLRQHVG